MSDTIETRLAGLGIKLPDAAPPVAGNYVAYVVTGNLVHVSGQISQRDGNLICGKLGEDLDLAQGADAAKACAVSLLTQLKFACGGDLSRLVRVIKLNAFVNSAPDFKDQPKVVNGASDFLVEVLGDVGRHARSAVGVAALPLGVAVEIDGVFEIK